MQSHPELGGCWSDAGCSSRGLPTEAARMPLRAGGDAAGDPAGLTVSPSEYLRNCASTVTVSMQACSCKSLPLRALFETGCRM